MKSHTVIILLLLCSWIRAVLRKVRKTVWEVLDHTGTELLFEARPKDNTSDPVKEWNRSSGSSWYRSPTEEEVQQALEEDGNKNAAMLAEEDKMLQISPKRKQLRDEGFKKYLEQAKRMKTRAGKLDGTVNVGDVVQVRLHRELHTKVDGKGLLAVVVEVLPSGQLRCATKAGVLKNPYARHNLTVMKGHMNDRSLVDGLEHAFVNWQEMRPVSEVAAKRVVSVATNPEVSCNCRGKCDTRRCPCRKADRLCHSRCHRGNSDCVNHEQPLE